MSKGIWKRMIHRAAALLLCLLLSNGATPTVMAAEARAIPSSSKVILDGQELICAVYNIGGSNYFKLRDLMQALDYGVGYDGASMTITIDTSVSYVPDGSETASKIAALSVGMSYALFPAQASISTVNVKVDGRPVYWEAYNIYGSNYFKLRDIGESLGLSVVWDETNDRVLLEISKGDSPDGPAAPDAPAMTIEEMKTEIIRLANAERAKAGQPELIVLQELMDTAQAKADDFRNSHYYGHTSPVYGPPGQMMRAAMPKSGPCAETLAPWTRTPEEAFAGWVESPEHLAIILSPKYTHIGAGIMEGVNGGYWWVLHFYGL